MFDAISESASAGHLHLDGEGSRLSVGHRTEVAGAPSQPEQAAEIPADFRKVTTLGSVSVTTTSVAVEVPVVGDREPQAELVAAVTVAGVAFVIDCPLDRRSRIGQRQRGSRPEQATMTSVVYQNVQASAASTRRAL